MKLDRRPQACAVCGAARPHVTAMAWEVHNRAEQAFFGRKFFTLSWQDGKALDIEKGLTVLQLRNRYPEVVGMIADPNFSSLEWKFGQVVISIQKEEESNGL